VCCSVYQCVVVEQCVVVCHNVLLIRVGDTFR